MYLEMENGYDRLNGPQMPSSITNGSNGGGHRAVSTPCPLKSCRSCSQKNLQQASNAAPVTALEQSNLDQSSWQQPYFCPNEPARIDRRDVVKEPEVAGTDGDVENPDKQVRTKICDKKCCNVGRNSKQRGRLIMPKMNFVDLSKIYRKNDMKMCMKTKLADTKSSGEDYLPLLITSTDDLVLPINAEEASPASKKSSFRCRIDRNTMTKLMETLARTFCLPLLG